MAADSYCGIRPKRAGSRATLLNILEMVMSTGTVKWFNPTKGYGFIQPQGGGQDVSVHISAVERAGLSTLNEGQQVEYEIVSNRAKSSAETLKVKGARIAPTKSGRKGGPGGEHRPKSKPFIRPTPSHQAAISRHRSAVHL